MRRVPIRLKSTLVERHADVEQVANFIGEHTDKLVEACRSASDLERRMLVQGVLWLASSTATAVLLTLAVQTFSLGQITEAFPWAIVGGLLGITVALMAMMLSAQRMEIALDEVRLRLRGLETLVRHASAIYENHQIIGVQKLHLEVRLGEAEAALAIGRRRTGNSFFTAIVSAFRVMAMVRPSRTLASQDSGPPKEAPVRPDPTRLTVANDKDQTKVRPSRDDVR
jgi:hypothetical protein